LGLDTTISVNCQAMTVDFYLVAIDRDVAFDQCEVNVDGFRIARQDRDKIGFSQLRQMAPIGSSTQFVKGRLDDRRVLKEGVQIS
jgi:hypothetical protein